MDASPKSTNDQFGATSMPPHNPVPARFSNHYQTWIRRRCEQASTYPSYFFLDYCGYVHISRGPRLLCDQTCDPIDLSSQRAFDVDSASPPDLPIMDFTAKRRVLPAVRVTDINMIEVAIQHDTGADSLASIDPDHVTS